MYTDYKYVFQVKLAGADLDKWYDEVATDIWIVEFEDSRKAAYSIIYLLFQNDKYCHSRSTAFAIYDYCGQE